MSTVSNKMKNLEVKNWKHDEKISRLDSQKRQTQDKVIKIHSKMRDINTKLKSHSEVQKIKEQIKQDKIEQLEQRILALQEDLLLQKTKKKPSKPLPFQKQQYPPRPNSRISRLSAATSPSQSQKQKPRKRSLSKKNKSRSKSKTRTSYDRKYFDTQPNESVGK